jgi:predicted small lipoprotein YifL
MKKLFSFGFAIIMILALAGCGGDEGFVRSVNSDVYHPADCKEVEKIKDENKVIYLSEEAAKKDGLRRSNIASCWKGR